MNYVNNILNEIIFFLQITLIDDYHLQYCINCFKSKYRTNNGLYFCIVKLPLILTFCLTIVISK